MPTDDKGNYFEPGYRRDYVPASPLAPSGQPMPSAPVDPTAAPGAAPREDNQHGWGKPGK